MIAITIKVMMIIGIKIIKIRVIIVMMLLLLLLIMMITLTTMMLTDNDHTLDDSSDNKNIYKTPTIINMK